MVEHAWPIAAGPSVGSVAGAAAAAAAAAATAAGEERWRHFDNSVNALSFGSHLRQNSGSRGPSDLESQQHYQQGRAFAGKLDFPSPKMSIYAKGVSVLMPGHDIPTFIAHPVPPPCPPERVSWPDHQPFRINNST